LVFYTDRGNPAEPVAAAKLMAHWLDLEFPRIPVTCVNFLDQGSLEGKADSPESRIGISPLKKIMAAVQAQGQAGVNALLAIGGGMPAVREAIEAASQLAFSGRVQMLTAARNHSVADIALTQPKRPRSEHIGALTMLDAAQDCVLNGDFSGAFGAVRSLNYQDSPWKVHFGRLRTFLQFLQGTQPNLDGVTPAHWPSLRRAFNVEAALSPRTALARQYPIALIDTVGLLETAIIPNIFKFLASKMAGWHITALEPEENRVIFVDNVSFAILETINIGNGLRLSDLFQPFRLATQIRARVELRRTWYPLLIAPMFGISASAVARAYHVSLFNDDEAVTLKSLRNHLAHGTLAVEQFNAIEPLARRVGFWTVDSDEIGGRFLKNPMIANLLKEFCGFPDAAALYKDHVQQILLALRTGTGTGT